MLRITVAAGIVLASLTLPASGENKPETVDPLVSLSTEEAVKRVSAGIRRNFDALKTVHARMQTVIETPSSDGAERREPVIKDGRVIGQTISRVPKRMVIKTEVWLTPRKLRATVTP